MISFNVATNWQREGHYLNLTYVIFHPLIHDFQKWFLNGISPYYFRVKIRNHNTNLFLSLVSVFPITVRMWEGYTIAPGEKMSSFYIIVYLFKWRRDRSGANKCLPGKMAIRGQIISPIKWCRISPIRKMSYFSTLIIWVQSYPFWKTIIILLIASLVSYL